MSQKPQDIYKFGPFTLNTTSCTFACGGQEIKIEPKTFDVLVFFVLHAGELVDREQIKLAVWKDVNVGENNVDRKISDIRKVLSQHDRSRKYIETVPSRGWRFTADVTVTPQEPTLVDAPAVTPPELAPPAVSHRIFRGQISLSVVGIAALALAVIATALMVAPNRPSPANLEPQAVEYRQLTTDGRPKAGPLVSDGRYVYFSERRGGAENGLARLAAVPIRGGDVLFPPNPADPTALILSVVRNTQDILYGRWDRGADYTLFVWRQKQRLLEQEVQTGGAARISPDGRTIAYITGGYPTCSIVIRDLAARPNIRRIPVSGDPSTLAWSPDGGHIRYSERDPVAGTAMFWEARRDGSDIHRLPLVSRPQFWWADGNWTANGDYFVYSEESAVSSSLWIRRENAASWYGRPVQLTNNPISFDLPAPAGRGNTVFARGSLSKNQLDRFDASRGEFVAFWEGVPAVDVSFSNDGARAAYRRPTDDTLWIGKSDGSERRQLTQPPLRAYQPHWSPDGSRIAFMGQAANQPSRIYIIAASGGQPQAVRLVDSLDQGVPTFSGDGRYLAYGELRQRRSDDEMLIRMLDLKTGKETVLPGSQAKWTPRWSPDGRYIVAMGTNFGSLSLFDCARRHWMPLVTAHLIEDPAWSLDSRFVHFSAETAGERVRTLFRVRVADGVVERLAPFPPWQVRWSGVSPDGSPLVLNSTRIEEIYAIDFK